MYTYHYIFFQSMNKKDSTYSAINIKISLNYIFPGYTPFFNE